MILNRMQNDTSDCSSIISSLSTSSNYDVGEDTDANKEPPREGAGMMAAKGKYHLQAHRRNVINTHPGSGSSRSPQMFRISKRLTSSGNKLVSHFTSPPIHTECREWQRRKSLLPQQQHPRGGMSDSNRLGMWAVKYVLGMMSY
eukprot:scaffold14195_cov155-Skeletonema_dohrnii-CCMP3373.AAC.25